MADARLSEAAVLGAVTAIPAARVSETFVLAAYGPPGAMAANLSETFVLAAVAGASTTPIPRLTELFVLVMYGVGVGDLPRARAWTFDFDGHSFYVLDLGLEGTWVYDMETEQWTKFETDGYEGVWNARHGVYWSNAKRTVISDALNSMLYFIEPTSALDEEWRPITYVATGGVEVHNRVSYRQDSFRITASSGELADAESDAEIVMSLRFSDDNGHNWIGPYEVVLVPGAYSQEVAWLSLGAVRAPGRIFELTDQGGLVKISNADAEIEGLDDGTEES